MKRQRGVVFVPTLKEARAGGAKRRKTRKGFQSVARTRGAAVTGEMKYFDVFLDSTAIGANNDWTGTEYDPVTFNTLFAPTVGAAVNQRIGKQCKVLKIKVNGMVTSSAQIDQTAADASCRGRVILFLDKQTNSTQAQGEQVMTTQTTDTLGVNAFQNIDNFGRFRVLKDKFFSLQNPNMVNDGTNVEQAGLVTPFKFSMKFKKPIDIRFNNTNGGTVADIVDNSFHIIANVHNAALAPQISYVARICYKE